MPRTWANERTVASVLADAGYYPTDPSQTKEQLQSQFVEEEDVMIGDKTYTLSRMSKYDIKLFADQLDKVVMRMNPLIWDIYAKYAVQCLAAARLANVQAKQGFRGAGAKGNELDFTTLNAREYYDPDNSGNTRVSWDRTISAVGQKNFVEGPTAGSPLTLGEEECTIYLAWYNPSPDPCIDAFQIILNTDLYDVQNLDFEMVNLDNGDTIIEFKEPFIIPPEEAYEILAYYYRTGTDSTRPIGLWFKEAKNLRDLNDLRLQ